MHPEASADPEGEDQSLDEANSDFNELSVEEDTALEEETQVVVGTSRVSTRSNTRSIDPRARFIATELTSATEGYLFLLEHKGDWKYKLVNGKPGAVEALRRNGWTEERGGMYSPDTRRWNHPPDWLGISVSPGTAQ